MLSRPCLTGWVCGLLITLCAACGTHSLIELPLTSLDGQTATLAQTQQAPYTAIFFLSPECPLCENYSKVINELRAETPSDSVAFFGVFPGRYYDKPTILGYLARYHPKVSVLLDPEYALTHALGATITPEVFLIDRAGTVLYSGAIDNWIPRLGVKRTVITEHYLRDALHAVQRQEAVPTTYQKPVGCFIE